MLWQAISDSMTLLSTWMPSDWVMYIDIKNDNFFLLKKKTVKNYMICMLDIFVFENDLINFIQYGIKSIQE